LWVAHDIRDEVVDFVNRWMERAELKQSIFISGLGISRSKYFNWKQRYGKVNEHNAWIPRDFWVEEWEKKRIIEYYLANPLEGYRRLTFMMLDADVAAVSPSTTYRVLRSAGLLRKWSGKPSRKGVGFSQPLQAHEHWHVDISYLNIRGTFYYLCSVLDGYSRYIVHHEIRESMREADVEIVLQRAKEKYPEARPRIISDNGPQFIARDFKEFIRLSGMTHVRTSPYYPQSNGKMERWNQSFKREAVRPKCPLDLQDGCRIAGEFVEHYNTVRLHSAIGYVTPEAKLQGREREIFAERDRKLEEAREKRRITRLAANAGSPSKQMMKRI
jgi:transposase InsO family protein